jgi:SpoU rRNA methylase family enzyme
MNEEEKVLQEIRDAVNALDPEKAAAVNKIADAIRDLIVRFNGVAELAIALVGAELAARGDR